MPFSDLPDPEAHNRPLVLVSEGIGITPMVGILERLAAVAEVYLCGGNGFVQAPAGLINRALTGARMVALTSGLAPARARLYSL